MTSDATSISLLNMKGGVGKTTLAVNLAWHLCRQRRKRVLLVDLDPQFNASQYTMNFEEWRSHANKKGTVADLLLDPNRPRMTVKKKRTKRSSRPAVYKYIFEREKNTNGGQLDILPAELALSSVVKNPQGVEYRLEKHLQKCATNYDFIFIDCAPTDSVLTDTALMASDFILTPVRPDRFSVLGYAQIGEVLAQFRSSYHDPHEVQDLGVVFTQVQGDSAIEDQCVDEIQQQADYVFESDIPKSNSYLRSVHQQAPVFDTRYTRRVTKRALDDLVDEIEQRIADID